MNATSDSPVLGRMRFRKLRIAWSVFWGLACVLLTAMLIRSFHFSDTAYGPCCGYRLLLNSNRDNVLFIANDLPPGYSYGWRYDIGPVTRFEPRITWFFFKIDTNPATLSFPQWLPIVLTAILAVLPWIRWSKRFTLRTLLIATTLVAVVLGLIVCVAK